MPKCLVPLGGEPLLTHLYEKLSVLPQVSELIVDTNKRFERLIEEWANRVRGKRIRIVADDSRREEEKPGALRALINLLPELDGDDVFVLAGDNIFDDDLRDMVRLYERARSTVIGVYNIGQPELSKQYSSVIIDPASNEVVSFEEKPKRPASSLIGTGLYVFPRVVLESLHEYLGNGGNNDSPGNFISWLIGKERVYAYRLEGAWFDVGTPETYYEAQDYFARKFAGSTRNLSHIWRPKVRERAEELIAKYGYHIIRLIVDSVIVAGASRTEEFLERYSRRAQYSSSKGIEFDTEDYYLRTKEEVAKVIGDPRFANIDNPFMKEQAIMLAESGVIQSSVLEEVLKSLLGDGRTDAQRRRYLESMGLISEKHGSTLLDIEGLSPPLESE